MMKVTVTLKKVDGKETVIVIAKDESDFAEKVAVLMKKRGAYGFGRQETTVLRVVR